MAIPFAAKYFPASAQMLDFRKENPRVRILMIEPLISPKQPASPLPVDVANLSIGNRR
jgi:hypothetical protein